MAIHTFSTKTSRPEDEKTVQAVKAYCEANCLVFSSVIVAKLKEFKEDKVDGRQR